VLHEIDVVPFERQNLAAAHAGVAAEQHHEQRARVDRACDLDESFVLVEIVEGCGALVDSQQLHRAGHPLDDFPLDRFLQQHTQHREDVVHGLGRFEFQLRLQPLYVFALDRVEPLPTERRNQVEPEDRVLRCDPAQLQPIRPGVAVDESRREGL